MLTDGKIISTACDLARVLGDYIMYPEQRLRRPNTAEETIQVVRVDVRYNDVLAGVCGGSGWYNFHNFDLTFFKINTSAGYL